MFSFHWQYRQSKVCKKAMQNKLAELDAFLIGVCAWNIKLHPLPCNALFEYRLLPNTKDFTVRQSFRIHCYSFKRPSKRSVYSLANKKWLPSHNSPSKLQIMSLRETFNWIKSFLLLIFNSSLLGYIICQ